MSVRVGINGFGRIGRLFLRAARKRGADLEVVAVNDLTDATTMAHLLKYDSVHGIWPGDVMSTVDGISIDGHAFKLFAERTLRSFPGAIWAWTWWWSAPAFHGPRRRAKHLDAGANKVIISAPSKDADLTVVMGVNDVEYDPARHDIISNASCTTNCLAPVAKVLLDSFGIEQAL